MGFFKNEVVRCRKLFNVRNKGMSLNRVKNNGFIFYAGDELVWMNN